MAPTTAVRAHTQAKYSKRFRTAYGHHRPGAGSLHHLSSTKSPAPGTDKPHAAPFPLSFTSLAEPNHSHQQTIPPFRTDGPPRPNRLSPSTERRQDEHSRCRRFVDRPITCTVLGRSVDITDTMSSRDRNPLGHCYLRPRSTRKAAPSYPLTTGRPTKRVLGDRPTSPTTRARVFVPRLADHHEPYTISMAATGLCNFRRWPNVPTSVKIMIGHCMPSEPTLPRTQHATCFPPNRLAQMRRNAVINIVDESTTHEPIQKWHALGASRITRPRPHAIAANFTYGGRRVPGLIRTIPLDITVARRQQYKCVFTKKNDFPVHDTLGSKR